MKSGSRIYQSLCKAGDIDHALRELTIDQLTNVASYLGNGMCNHGGIPAMVWGAVQCELGRREPESTNSIRK